MSIRLVATLDGLRSRLWVIPGIFVVASIVAAQVLVAFDRLIDGTVEGRLSGVLFAGGADSARLVLATIATAMLTFTGLVYTVTMLVLQLASSQLSPRVMRTFLRDRVNQTVLGLFIATFLYALLVLRDVRSPPSAFVPAIAVTVAYVLLLASVASFVVYIHHMAQSIRAASVLHNVGDETRQAIARLYLEDVGAEPEPPAPEWTDRPPDAVITFDRPAGVITAIDVDTLVSLAREYGIRIELPHTVGDFVPTGSSLLHIWHADALDTETETPAAALADAVQIGRERTMTQDAAFGFRQIVDIAERALSPGVNDPTTAVQSLDQLHDLLRRLAVRRLASDVRLADDGSVLLRLPRPDWSDYVALALDEIRQYGAGSIQVARRLRFLLLDLQNVAPASRQGPLVRQVDLLDAALATAYEFPEDRRSAAAPSPSGQGPTEAPSAWPTSGGGGR